VYNDCFLKLSSYYIFFSCKIYFSLDGIIAWEQLVHLTEQFFFKWVKIWFLRIRATRLNRHKELPISSVSDQYFYFWLSAGIIFTAISILRANGFYNKRKILYERLDRPCKRNAKSDLVDVAAIAADVSALFRLY